MVSCSMDDSSNKDVVVVGMDDSFWWRGEGEELVGVPPVP